MHRLIRENLEEVLQAKSLSEKVAQHLAECAGCREEAAAMRQQAILLRDRFAAPSTTPEPRAGFYARVMDRIETQGSGSIWSLFFESAFSRRLAIASLSLSILAGVYLFSVEPMDEAQAVYALNDGQEQVLGVPIPDGQFVAMHDSPGIEISSEAPDPDSVLVNLVTYREQ